MKSLMLTFSATSGTFWTIPMIRLSTKRLFVDESERAWELVVLDEGNLHNAQWFPKSRCSFSRKDAAGKDGLLTVPRWLAEKKGLGAPGGEP